MYYHSGLERQEVDVMSQSLGFRLVIQKPTGNKDKYYVGVIDGTITHAHPFKISTADIVIDTTAGPTTSYYLAPVTIDDIVRIQVNAKLSATEPDVWLDMFEGRISKIGNSYSASSNEMRVTCKGHGAPLGYSYFTSDQTFTSKTTGYIVDAMMDLLDRITDDIPSLVDQTGSATLSEYTVSAYGKSFADVIADLENIEFDSYGFRLKTVYDEDGNLSEVNPVWEPIGEVTDIIQVNEGSRSLISANFTVQDRMYNYILVSGDGVSAYAEDTDLQDLYDLRVYPVSDNSLTTATSCQEVADALLARWKEPVIVGTATVRGEPLIRAGDRVHCRLSSINVNGYDIDDDYMVRKVVHKIGSKFETTLTLGEVDLSPSEVIYIMLNSNKRNNLNSI
jgi:hypothetical protein